MAGFLLAAFFCWPPFGRLFALAFLRAGALRVFGLAVFAASRSRCSSEYARASQGRSSSAVRSRGRCGPKRRAFTEPSRLIISSIPPGRFFRLAKAATPDGRTAGNRKPAGRTHCLRSLLGGTMRRRLAPSRLWRPLVVSAAARLPAELAAAASSQSRRRYNASRRCAPGRSQLSKWESKCRTERE